MKYMGSKNKIAKHLLPIILQGRTKEQYYVEPFVGGCNMIDKVQGLRIGADNNEYLIEMLKYMQTNGIPFTSIPKDTYDEARKEYRSGVHKYTKAQIGLIGFMGSFNGRFYDGGYSGKTEKRDYVDEQLRNTIRQLPDIKDVEFIYASYDNLNIPPNSIVYCDIPYKNTKQYDSSKNFDHDKFFQWVREKTSEGHTVYVSEYTAPDDFECIFELTVTNSMGTTSTKRPVEKLFKYKGDK